MQQPYVGAIALVISVALAIVEFRRSRRPLIIRCTYIDPHVSSSKSQCLFLLRLSFINQASVGKTAFNVGLQAIRGYEISQAPAQYNAPKEAVRFLFHEANSEGVEIQSSDTFFRPLDIFPHRSESRWFGLVVSPVPPLTSDSSAAKLRVAVFDVNGGEMAKTEITLMPTWPSVPPVS